jgi:RNA polymerase sigma-70 factor (ECF subfamily)
MDSMTDASAPTHPSSPAFGGGAAPGDVARGNVTRDGAYDAAESRAQDALGRSDHRAALTVLMDAYGNDIYRFCRRLTGDAQLAEDLRQVIFMQAFEDLSRLPPRSTLRGWLYGIARHRCLDACKGRRRWRKHFQLTDALPEQTAAAVPDPADALDQTALQRALTHCLDKLDVELRMLIHMRYQDGLSYTELSGAFGAEPATLQARVTRAMPGLRRCVRGQGVTP